MASIIGARLLEAQTLFNFGHYSGAYYLAGYSLECLLKSFIAGQIRSNELPDRDFVNKAYSHKLDQLLYLGNLKTQLDAAKKVIQTFRSVLGIVDAMGHRSEV